uniref:(northern house mosquito) hypothetical protein n=1 Tax=Culex pipiens TaxID=7175 RepID=A0A8D8ETR1_CULPI
MRLPGKCPPLVAFPQLEWEALGCGQCRHQGNGILDQQPRIGQAPQNDPLGPAEARHVLLRHLPRDGGTVLLPGRVHPGQDVPEGVPGTGPRTALPHRVQRQQLGFHADLSELAN